MMVQCFSSISWPSYIAQWVAYWIRTGGRWFDPQLGQYSFQGLMIVIATGFIPLKRCPLFQRWLHGKAASGLERMMCRVLVKNELRKAWIGGLAAAI